MNKSVNVTITSELKNPTTAGMHYRFLCMTGPDKGKVYYLTGKRIIIGRGENSDILIVDPKISREHAELSFSDNGYTVTDLGAQNGILVNDNKVKQKKLADNEKVVIGQTVFKYNIIEVVLNTEVEISSEEDDSSQTKISKIGKAKTTLKSNYAGAESFSSKKSNPPEKKGNSRVLIMGGIVAIVLYVLMGKDEPVKTSKVHNDIPINDFDNKDPTPPRVNDNDVEAKKKLESYIHSGRREFGEGNYFRAMEDFRLALLLSPNNGHASFYLSKAKQRLDEDIDKNFLKAKQEYEAKKLQASIVSYCGVVQLIQNYPDDERYKNAMLKISAIEAELGMEKGEAKCFEEKSADSKN